MHEKKIYESIVDACSSLYARGMVSGTGGNVSVKAGRHIFITATGKSLGRLGKEDIVKMDLQGNVISGGQPSKEVRMHLAVINRRKDTKAVIHIHPAHCISLSCRQKVSSLDAIPAMTPGFVARVGKVPMVDFQISGSRELCDKVAELIEEHPVVLLQNHGIVVAGETIENCVDLAEEVEENARIYILAGEKARVMGAADRERIRKLFCKRQG